MKFTKIFTVLLLFSVLFAGCPYSAEIGLDETPAKAIDNSLLGKWESKGSNDYLYTVSKKTDKIYSIDKKSISSGDVTSYIGFLSDVDGTVYLNVYEDGSTTTTYYFYKLEKSASGARITLAPVTEHIDEKFESSAEMKNFFKKNQKLSFFFDKEEEVYIRAE